jgi:hypothetical protein
VRLADPVKTTEDFGSGCLTAIALAVQESLKCSPGHEDPAAEA